MRIEVDDLTRPQVVALLEEHLADMHEWSPPESVHALDLAKLRAPEITFWTIWSDAGELLACGALKHLSAEHAEVKSMRTPKKLRGQGAGRAMLEHILREAQQRGYRLVSLETGSQDAFAPARTLYESAGFRNCGPFGNYRADPHSTFMELRLQDR